ncbi:MAG: hypothetical protein ABI346_10760 [Candidatus Baltobacteraceae bacterium]
MAERFEALDAKLRAPNAVFLPVKDSPRAQDAVASPALAPQPHGVDARTLREFAVLRLAAAEACERACRRVVGAFAEDVLGRELQLAPADLERLIDRAREALRASEPIALAIGPQTVLQDCGLPTRVDPALGPSDALIEVRDGIVDLRLCIRFEAVLEDLR